MGIHSEEAKHVNNILSKLPKDCPVCGAKMEKGYVSASPDVYWSEKRVTWRFWRTRWEPLLGGRFAKWIQPVNAEAYRCPNCKVVLFSYDEKGACQVRARATRCSEV